jgi:hypothetical protein
MSYRPNPNVPLLLLASAVLFGPNAAQAAADHMVSRSQQALVTTGMSSANVASTLGRPSSIDWYSRPSSSAWTYKLATDAFPGTLFIVNFGVDGKVASAVEQVEQPGGN